MRALSLLSRFQADHRGMVAVIGAIALLPILSVMGLAVDYARATKMRSVMQSAADAAVLAAVTAAQTIDLTTGTTSSPLSSAAQTEAQNQAALIFSTLMTGRNQLSVADLRVTITKSNDGTYTASGEFSASYSIMMAALLPQSSVLIGGKSTASVATSGSGFMELTTLMDMSASMGVGASPADIAILRQKTGCAFSCHSSQQTYGATLRIDVMRNAVRDMITLARNAEGSDRIRRIKIAMHRFEGTFQTIEPLTNDYGRLMSGTSRIQITQDGSYTTNIGGALSWLTPTITASGTGTTEKDPRKFVFLITDGIENRAHRSRPVNYLPPFAYSGNVGSLDPAHCKALKDKGVTIGVLYTTYYDIGAGYDYYYKAALPMVEPRLRDCASPNFFFQASDAAAMKNEFAKMFQKAVTSAGVKLTQ